MVLGSALLHNVLETLGKQQLQDGCGAESAGVLVARVLQTTDWLDTLCMPDANASSFPARRKHGRDILLRILALNPWALLDAKARVKVCQCINWLLDPGSSVELLVEVLQIAPLLFNQVKHVFSPLTVEG